MLHKTLYFNGEIHTCNSRGEIVSAMLTEDDRILFCGSEQQARCLADADTAFIDLAKKAVVAGFIDSGVHMQADIKSESDASPQLISDINLAEKARGFCEKCLSFGITSVCDFSDFGAESIRTQTKAASHGKIPVRVSHLIWHNGAEAARALQLRMLDCGIGTGFGDLNHHIGAAILSLTKEAIAANPSFEAEVARLVDCGIQVQFEPHDEFSLLSVIEAYESAINGKNAIRRGKVMVDFPLSDEMIDRLAYAKMTVLVQPYPLSFGLSAKSRQTTEPLPLAAMLGRGVLVAFASRASRATNLNPFLGIAEVLDDQKIRYTTHPPRRKISLEQALRCYTFHGAFGDFSENSTGSLEWGKKADFCILTDSLLSKTPDEIRKIKVHQTVVGGRTVFESKPAEEFSRVPNQ